MIAPTDNPCLSPAWLGYKADDAGLLWQVCAWCPPVAKVPVEREAERLCVRVSHGICKVCAARMLGDELPGLSSEQP